jgi:hypothetical protein
MCVCAEYGCVQEFFLKKIVNECQMTRALGTELIYKALLKMARVARALPKGDE